MNAIHTSSADKMRSNGGAKVFIFIAGLLELDGRKVDFQFLEFLICSHGNHSLEFLLVLQEEVMVYPYIFKLRPLFHRNRSVIQVIDLRLRQRQQKRRMGGDDKLTAIISRKPLI